jgi:ferritin-like metal-binding protein YciE
MAEKDLKALFVHQLKDTYFAENAILKEGFTVVTLAPFDRRWRA